MNKNIVIYSQNEIYSLVIRTWDEDENGQPINVKSLTEINLTWEQVIKKINQI